MAHLSRHSEIESVRMRWMLMLAEVGKILRAGPKDALSGRGLLRSYCAPRVVQFMQHSAGTKFILIDKKIYARFTYKSRTVKTINVFTTNAFTLKYTEYALTNPSIRIPIILLDLGDDSIDFGAGWWPSGRRDTRGRDMPHRSPAARTSQAG